MTNGAERRLLADQSVSVFSARLCLFLFHALRYRICPLLALAIYLKSRVFQKNPGKPRKTLFIFLARILGNDENQLCL